MSDEVKIGAMPVFVIKAKDALAYETISAYRRLCWMRGLVEQGEEVGKALDEIAAWQAQHQSEVQLPTHKHVPVAAALSAPSEPVPDRPRVWGGPGCCRAAYESEGHAHDHVDGTVQYGYRYRAVDRAWTRTWKCKDRDEAESLVAHVRGEGAAEAEVMTRVVQPWRTVSEVVEESTP